MASGSVISPFYALAKMMENMDSNGNNSSPVSWCWFIVADLGEDCYVRVYPLYHIP
ncbi:hypothetical protein MTR_4g113920 [Medicago truncatula]|uniref:Uncharacterized protein n=1 Tax=Medicago truncatula TaxID=3880 RepID=G7JVB6_MEDTR|nr:hypothetical protein MTR_4g113920 [Medicago truncatula]